MKIDEINEVISALHPDYCLDENGEPFAFLRVGSKIKAVPIQSGSFEFIVQNEAYRTLGTYIKEADFKFFRKACLYITQAGGETRPLPVRVARDAQGNIIYDLRRDDGRQVKITPDGWSIESQQVVFRDVGCEVPLPVIGGDIAMLDWYLNIHDPDQRLLVVVAAISMFVQNVAHPVLVLNGEQGSGKSCLSRVVKRVIDPSNIEISHLVNSIRDTQLTIANNWVTAFDNLSGFSEAMSDFFCGVVTGQSIQRRRLYTNDQMMTIKLRRCLILNGIGGVVTRPDLFDRSIIIDLRRLSENERKQEQHIFDSLDHELPYILGAIFDILSRTMRVYSETEFDFDLGGRLVDFAAYGFAIAEAMGVGGEHFVEAYKANSRVIAAEILESNAMVEPLMGYLNTLELPLEVKVSQFFSRFRTFANGHYDAYINRGLPKSPQRFSREFKLCLGSLETRGYYIDFQRRAEGTFLLIGRVETVGKAHSEDSTHASNIPPEIDDDPPHAA
jgi:hypothetical protein